MGSGKTKRAQALTAKAIEAMKPDSDGAYRVPDLRCKGLALRVATDGGKTWDLSFRIKGAGGRRLSLGNYTDVGLEAARHRANELTSAGRRGQDLIAEEKKARNEYDQAFTLERLTSEYAKRRLKGRLRTATAIENRIQRALAPVMKRKATDIRRRDLRQLLDAVADQGHKGEAEKRRTTIQPMFKWALQQDIIEIDPSAGLSPYSRSVARERVLDRDEIRTLWGWLETNDMPSHISDILKLQLCVGARVGEVCGLTTEELERDGAGHMVWVLPAARSKNGAGRITPITGLALEIIERRIGDGPLFASPSETLPNASIVGHAIIERRTRSPIPNWRSHDLRRTVATEMAKLELPLDLVATVLGQKAGEPETRVLRKHYIHNQFVDRKTHALKMWDQRLRSILAGEEGKVVALGYNHAHTKNVKG
jgi:integrase